MRFGGGAAYSMFGRVALGGNRNKLLGYAGYNKSGLSYLDENVAGIPLVLGAGLFTNVPQALCEKENYKLESNLKTGFYIAPDFCIGNDIKCIFDFGKSKETEFNLDYLLSPYIFLKLFHSEKVFSTTEVRSYNYILQNAYSIEAAYTINCSPAKKFNLAVLLSCGFSKDTKINLAPKKHAFTSYELGLLKPDTKIYQTLIDKLQTTPEQILFIDDKEKNIAAAQQIGINGIVFNKETILQTLNGEKYVCAKNQCDAHSR
jgi:hypothetical protein